MWAGHQPDRLSQLSLKPAFPTSPLVPASKFLFIIFIPRVCVFCLRGCAPCTCLIPVKRPAPSGLPSLLSYSTEDQQSRGGPPHNGPDKLLIFQNKVEQRYLHPPIRAVFLVNGGNPGTGSRANGGHLYRLQDFCWVPFRTCPPPPLVAWIKMTESHPKFTELPLPPPTPRVQAVWSIYLQLWL